MIDRALSYTLELCSYIFCSGSVIANKVQRAAPAVLWLERASELNNCLLDQSFLPDHQERRALFCLMGKQSIAVHADAHPY